MSGTIFSMPRPQARPWSAQASPDPMASGGDVAKPPPVELSGERQRPQERDAATPRHALLERGAAEIARARRYDRPLALICISARGEGHVRHIDGALRDVLEGATRAGADVVIRTGEAAFVCLLPETNLSGSMHLAARIQRTLRDLSIGGGGIASRLGFAALAREDRSFASVLGRAEAMLTS